MKFITEAHRSKGGQWTGQILLAGQVLYEDEDNATESQARANAEQSFAFFLSQAIEREIDLLCTEAETEANG